MRSCRPGFGLASVGRKSLLLKKASRSTGCKLNQKNCPEPLLPNRLLFGGDAGAAIWSKILRRSDKDTLQWDLFLAPHHCSWSFFSELPYKENKIPADDSLEILKPRFRSSGPRSRSRQT